MTIVNIVPLDDDFIPVDTTTDYHPTLINIDKIVQSALHREHSPKERYGGMASIQTPNVMESMYFMNIANGLHVKFKDRLKHVVKLIEHQPGSKSCDSYLERFCYISPSGQYYPYKMRQHVISPKSHDIKSWVSVSNLAIALDSINKFSTFAPDEPTKAPMNYLWTLSGIFDSYDDNTYNIPGMKYAKSINPARLVNNISSACHFIETGESQEWSPTFIREINNPNTYSKIYSDMTYDLIKDSNIDWQYNDAKFFADYYGDNYTSYYKDPISVRMDTRDIEFDITGAIRLHCSSHFDLRFQKPSALDIKPSEKTIYIPKSSINILDNIDDIPLTDLNITIAVLQGMNGPQIVGVKDSYGLDRFNNCRAYDTKSLCDNHIPTYLLESCFPGDIAELNFNFFGNIQSREPIIINFKRSFSELFVIQVFVGDDRTAKITYYYDLAMTPLLTRSISMPFTNYD